MEISEDFKLILEEINDNISDDILNNNIIKQSCNFIDVNDENSVTFLKKSVDTNNGWVNNKRQPLKIGRFIKKTFFDKYDNYEIENFTYEYKSILRSKKLTFKIVEGDDIVRWYLDESYKDICGSLGRSCMRFKRCQRFFDIYTKNPEKIKLLILLDVDGKLLGRALIWYLDKPNRIFMDKIYVNYNYDYNLFIKYANQRKWLLNYKKQMIVKIKNREYDLFPYIDTLYNYDYENNILTNSITYLKKTNIKEYYNLSCIFGDYDIIKL